jgi:hypothetical protein
MELITTLARKIALADAQPTRAQTEQDQPARQSIHLRRSDRAEVVENGP